MLPNTLPFRPSPLRHFLSKINYDKKLASAERVKSPLTCQLEFPYCNPSLQPILTQNFLKWVTYLFLFEILLATIIIAIMAFAKKSSCTVPKILFCFTEA